MLFYFEIRSAIPPFSPSLLPHAPFKWRKPGSHPCKNHRENQKITANSTQETTTRNDHPRSNPLRTLPETPGKPWLSSVDLCDRRTHAAGHASANEVVEGFRGRHTKLALRHTKLTQCIQEEREGFRFQISETLPLLVYALR